MTGKVLMFYLQNKIYERYIVFKARFIKLFPSRGSYSSIAQSVEHAAVNRGVVGSSPTGGVVPV